MISYLEALTIVEQVARSKKRANAVQTLDLLAAQNHTLARDLFSPVSMPRFRNSSMDGFAVRASETSPATNESPVAFTILGVVAAGDAPIESSSFAERGVAWEIMTGAPIPDGFDAVIKVEEARCDGNLLVVSQAIRVGENVRMAGEDFTEGSQVAARGERLGPEQILAASSLGISEVEVVRPVKIAVVSTGAELVSHQKAKHPLASGQIYNSTGPYLQSALSLMGATVSYYGVVKDCPKLFLNCWETIVKEAPDVIVTTGAVSMGKYDFVTSALRDLGAEILFHKVAIRPGKPVLFAHLPGTHTPVVFGLPGNPVSTVVGTRFFIEPFLRAHSERPPETPAFLRLSRALQKPDGFRCFFKAKLNFQSGEASVLAGQGSHLVRPLLEGNGWVVLPEAGSQFAEGSFVPAVPLHSLTWEGNRCLWATTTK